MVRRVAGSVYLQGALEGKDLLVAVLELACLLGIAVDIVLFHLHLERQLLHALIIPCHLEATA